MCCEKCKCEKCSKPKLKDVRIVILQRGWVVIGDYSRKGDDCFLHRAKVIRVWGTTDGLGQLINGPTKDTKLDNAGTIEYHVLTAIATMKANSENWTCAL